MTGKSTESESNWDLFWQDELKAARNATLPHHLGKKRYYVSYFQLVQGDTTEAGAKRILVFGERCDGTDSLPVSVQRLNNEKGIIGSLCDVCDKLFIWSGTTWHLWEQELK